MSEKEHKYHHGNLRAALVEAAHLIMAEGGVDKVTVRAVSERVGVSRAALYRHFDGKNALLCTVAEQGFRQLRDKLLKESSDPEEDCIGKFERLAVTYVRFAMENPRFYRLMFSKGPVTSDPTDELKKAAKEAFVAGLSVFEECHSSGMIKGEPFRLINVAWSMLHGMAMLMIEGQLDREQAVHKLLASSVGSAVFDGEDMIRYSVRTMIEGMREQ